MLLHSLAAHGVAFSQAERIPLPHSLAVHGVVFSQAERIPLLHRGALTHYSGPRSRLCAGASPLGVALPHSSVPIEKLNEIARVNDNAF